MTRAYLLLGGNEGNRASWLRQGMAAVGQQCGTIVRSSSVYETAAWGIEDQPSFLNMVLEVDTSLSPSELLKHILEIEQQLGRIRSIKWGQRRLDIDILFYGEEVIGQPGLNIPHPHIAERRFTLVPMAELSPGFMHPLLHKTIRQLLEDCPDPLEVKKLDTEIL